jgi:Zn-dependent protease
MFPIPPLDGSRIADYLMPSALRPLWESFEPMAPFALMAVILLPRATGVNLFTWPMTAADALLHFLLRLVA